MNATEGRNPSAKGEVCHRSHINEDSCGCKRKGRRRG
jgi:hypothetical protein